MSLPSNTDLTEEDAADLQFPKEHNTPPTVSSPLLCRNRNANCEIYLSDRYILCAQCGETICLNCFATGAEVNSHKNDHPYKIINNDFELFENSDWTAKEELALVNGLLTYCNWQVINKKCPALSQKNVEELKQHYDHFYLEKNGSDKFPVYRPGEEIENVKLKPYRLKTNDVPDPVRGDENVYVGYSASRSDFEYDYDKNAEDLVASLKIVKPNDEDYELMTDLQMGVLNIYRRRLGERQRRKRILREHGLIMPQKTKSWLQRYHTTISPMVCDKMTRFMQFFTGQKFVYVMEGLHRIGELKIQIAKLLEYRRRGITNLEGARLYLKLKKHRDGCMQDLRRFQQASELKSFKYKQIIPLNLGHKRRAITPLDIVGLPGYDKLTPNEREFSRTYRFSPDNYLDLKNILIQENNKQGNLRLLTARRLLKIDVNKTRKLYDFLISEGHIVGRDKD